MIRIPALSLILSLLFFSMADAAEIHWQFSGWEGGGCYPNVEFDPNVRNRVYLTSDVAGLWRSNDLRLGVEPWPRCC